MLAYPSNFLAKYLRVRAKMHLPLFLFGRRGHTDPARTHPRHQWMMTHVVVAHYHWGTGGADDLLVGLAKNKVSDQLIIPLHAWLIHQRVVPKEPLIEKVFRQELLEHITINLLLVLSLSWVVTQQVVGLEDLHDLLSVYRPVLEGASANLPLILAKVLF